MKALAVLCLGLVTSVQAATIAIIDSGVDYTHTQLKSNIWSNSFLRGWNFAENNSKIFDPSVLATFSPDVKKYTEIVSKSYLFSITPEEKTWAMEKQKEKGFSQEVDRFGTYVHGTHVAGIAMKGTSHKIMGIKLLPTPAKATMAESMQQKSMREVTAEDPEKVLSFLLVQLAVKSASKMKDVGAFVGKNGAHIANGSFGTGIYQAAGLADQAFQIVFKRAPSDEELVKYAMLFMELTIMAGKSFVEAAPNTLFVFAAGNDNLSNDNIGASPANIKADNTITVAATYKDLFFAPFSNYGTKMVEVAAPGMLIKSSIPGNDYLSVSGTSQAAPFVANVAGLMKDANPALKPGDLKKILMGTVDKKEFLAKRVASGGIVNSERAVFAAVMSKIVSIDEAIERANLAIIGKKSKVRIGLKIPTDVRPIQMPSLFEL